MKLSRDDLRAAGCVVFAVGFFLGCRPSPPAAKEGGPGNLLGEGASIPAYHALVVAINDYRYWPALREARQDAEKVSLALREKYGYVEVRALLDGGATKEAMVLALREYGRSLKGNDALLVYFAGHGFYDSALKQGYWIPVEGREKAGGQPATFDWFSNGELRDLLAMSEARHVFVVSDCCFGGALLRGMSVVGPESVPQDPRARYRAMIARPSRWCLSGGDLRAVPDRSVFSRRFLSELQFPRQPVFSASELSGWIREEVTRLNTPPPVFGPLLDAAGTEGGEFVFLATGPARAGTGVRPPALPTVHATEPPSAPPRPALRPSPEVVVPPRPPPSATVPEKAPPPPPVRVIIKDPLPKAPPPMSALGLGKETRAVGLDDRVQLELVRAPSGFWVGRYEVTQAQYQALMGDNPSVFKDPQRPVDSVTWSEALEFCQKLTDLEKRTGSLSQGFAYRLPKQKEWEEAAGDASPKDAVSSVKRVRAKTEPAGSLDPNRLGLHDILGNVWEWGDEWADARHQYRVVRGGGWSTREVERLAFTAHDGAVPVRRNEINGFRVFLVPTP